jgi:hypothetical protein
LDFETYKILFWWFFWRIAISIEISMLQMASFNFVYFLIFIIFP